MKKIKLIATILVLIICIASLTACTRAEQYFVYFTTLEVKTKGASSDTPKSIYEYISSLEGVLSATVEGSDVYRINHSSVGEKTKVGAITLDILRTAHSVYEASDGAYDPSVYPLVRLWKFSGDTFGYVGEEITAPTQAQIDEALRVVGFDKAFSIDYDDSTVTKLIDGAMLDLGGVAKGYVADNCLNGRDGKILVNLGGNIAVIGKDYSIGIANPSREGREYSTSYFASFTLANGKCVSTSGDYERYYTSCEEGREVVYHHIINPFTGKPADTIGDGGVISCSVVSEDGALGDAVATAVVVLGKEKGVALLRELGLDGLIICSDNSVETVGNVVFNLK